VTYGLMDGPAGGWARPSPLTSVIIGVLLLAAFVAWERRVGVLAAVTIRNPRPEGRPAPQHLLHCALDAPASPAVPHR
jgi:hypothetical protein